MSPDEYKQFEIDYNIDVSNRQNEEPLNDSSSETDHPAKANSSSYEYKTMEIHGSDSHIRDDVEQVNITEQQSSGSQIQQNFKSPPTVEAKFSTTFSSDISNNILECGDQQLMPIDSKLDEFDLFCRSVAAQLRSISDTYSRSVAKLKIQQILFEAETGHYRSSPCITIPVTQNVNNI